MVNDEKSSEKLENKKDEVPEVALEKSDSGKKSEGAKIDVNVLRSVQSIKQHKPREIKRDVKVLKSEEFEEPLEDIVSRESEDVSSGEIGSEGVDYESGSRDLSEVRRTGGGMRPQDDQMYMAGDSGDESFYESGGLAAVSGGPNLGVVYDPNLKMDSSERSWSDTSHWSADKTMADVRAIDGSNIRDPNSMIEGETSRGPGERDGFSRMRGTPKYS